MPRRNFSALLEYDPRELTFFNPAEYVCYDRIKFFNYVTHTFEIKKFCSDHRPNNCKIEANRSKDVPMERQDIENNVLGSQPCMELLQYHYPSYWFSAHLHCKFAALVPEEKGTRLTRFLALDKCLPERKFLQVVEIEHDESAPMKLCYDLEWLTILFLTNHLLSVKPGLHYMPGPAGNGRWIYTPSVEEKENVLKKFNHDLDIPLNFKPTVEPYKLECPNTPAKNSLKLQINHQTTKFCNTLRIDDPAVLLQMVKGNQVESKSEMEDDESRHVDTPCTRHESSDISCTSIEESSENITLSEFRDSPGAINSAESYIVPSLLNDSSLTAAQEESTDANISKDNESEISITDDTEPVRMEPNCKKFKRRNHSIYSSTF